MFDEFGSYIWRQMEKYSKHLETIVSERTADLVVEKQKTDRLLYSKLLTFYIDHRTNFYTINYLITL